MAKRKYVVTCVKSTIEYIEFEVEAEGRQEALDELFGVAKDRVGPRVEIDMASFRDDIVRGAYSGARKGEPVFRVGQSWTDEEEWGVDSVKPGTV